LVLRLIKGKRSAREPGGCRAKREISLGGKEIQAFTGKSRGEKAWLLGRTGGVKKAG